MSDPQPKTALTALIGGNETAKDVSTAEELTVAIADTNVNTVKLAANIDISSSLTVNRPDVTLDLNGHVLKYGSANNGSVIVVENGGQLTIEDSNTSNLAQIHAEWQTVGAGRGKRHRDRHRRRHHRRHGNGPLNVRRNDVVLRRRRADQNGGSLTMRGGNIIGCSAECGGGVCIDSERNGEPGQFSMSGGSIIGCVASNSGGGVFASGKFKMSGQAVIRSCTVESATQFVCGGGVYVNVSSSFEMSDTAKIEGCQAISTSAYGGGVYVSSSSSFCDDC